LNDLHKKINYFLDRYLITVQKPGRYVGGEFNQVIKDWQKISVKIALAFPDIYDIGLSNLGLSVLYEIVNNQDWALAERTYAPWPDFEQLLRKHHIPLYSLETKSPLRSFDLIGFSLPYETLFTNLLNMLDLSEIPIRSTDRREDDPIILAGGHACFNPEPMHAFVDAFAIGDGEEIILDILTQYRQGKTAQLSRSEIIDSLDEIEGVYIPSHFQVVYDSNQKITEVKNIRDPQKYFITKRIVKKLPPPPVNQIVPNIQVVHDRATIEIMRGCSRGCRFCQAGFITRPVRERPIKDIIEAITATVNQTGFEEVALLSLSSSDFSRINELIEEIEICSQALKYDISLPSLRIESFDDALVQSMKNKRKGNFTLAPESASERIREKINKPISDDDLLAAVERIFSMGWRNIKLYYMIGFPDERAEDVHAIATMCNKIYAVGKKILHKKSQIHISINTFIPKPHTPLQWASFPNHGDVESKYRQILNEITTPGVKIDWSDYGSSYLEACLSRGDRRLSSVIETAWRIGCKFDAWHEHFKFNCWMDAFRKNRLDADFYTIREKSVDEILPWDHIHTGVNKNFLVEEYKKSHSFRTTADCRETCNACGIQDFYKLNCAQIRNEN